MIGISRRRPRLVALAIVVLSIGLTGYRGEAKASGAHHSSGVALLRRWNQIAIDASGLDHTPPAPGETRLFGEQIGPGRASRAMAIVHIAMFDAINAISGKCRTYTGIHRAPAASMDSAIVQAAHDTLSALFPSQAPTFDTLLVQDLTTMRPGQRNAKAKGIALGHRAASAILGMRANDGSQIPEPHMGVDFIPSLLPGMWRQDPISLLGLALGAYWGDVQPFVLASSSQFRAPVPPALTSAEYTSAYDEEKSIGGDGIGTPTVRTPEQTVIGTFWAYDGTPSLCAPPRLYNQITVHIADQIGTSADVVQFSRLLALVNTSMADAGIAIWESKYFYQYWRPVAGIQESDPGTGPTGLGDGNPATIGDPAWSPLGAPASNLIAVNFTPPFPAYPSGHAGFGGALFETLRHFYGTDQIAFRFMSDEFNGVTKDHNGVPRPKVTRRYGSLSQAEEENGQSRIYLGIHWRFDKTEGIAQGRKVGDWVFDHAFTPKKSK
ncbi:MAG: vanadium-dependent haloperoxidase [Candidatus Binatus sp.]|uniref:vanadium-dependent haloperoxidase n=1 Tax=Candidatus Binatus sp. TaxID=2811406 RepID=UPI002724920C|nr:vanadium-dependent haloperoxidase [Candidatus Binatus sp.]MDO8432731.1 vanadium-dependent haloperoxidase [Candidatus Binatus sp.]